MHKVLPKQPVTDETRVDKSKAWHPTLGLTSTGLWVLICNSTYRLVHVINFEVLVPGDDKRTC